MAIRRAIKQIIKQILGIESAQTASSFDAHSSPSSIQTTQSTAQPANTESSAQRQVEGQSNTTSSAQRQPEEQSNTTPSSPTSSGNKVSQEKIQRHLRRTKKGLLQFLHKQNGTADLASLHHHSETRFLIGHQKFSELMEQLVAEELITYDWDNQEAHLSQKGRDFLSNPAS